MWENHIFELYCYGIMERKISNIELYVCQIFGLIHSLKGQETEIMDKMLEKIKGAFNWIKMWLADSC